MSCTAARRTSHRSGQQPGGHEETSNPDFGQGGRCTAGQKLGRVWGTLQCWAPEIFQREAEDSPGQCLEPGCPVLHCRGGLPFEGATWKLKEQVLRARYIPSDVSTKREAPSLQYQPRTP